MLQRPSLLMMVVRLRANESTLELGLANLNEQREAATKWLDKLGVLRIEFSEPFTLARQNAEMLARDSGMSLGKICMVSRSTLFQRHEGHARMMAQQCYMSILADASYKLEENEMVSDDPRSVTFTVSVSTTYYLE